MSSQPIVIDKWYEGIAESPHAGLGLIRNADIEAFPNAIKSGRKPATIFHTAISVTFTADASTDICTAASAVIARSSIAVTFSSSGTLPAGLTAGTVYFLSKLSSTTFKVCTTLNLSMSGVTVVDITNAGTGTHTMTSVNPGTIKHIIKALITAGNAHTAYYMQDSNNRIWFYSPVGASEYTELEGFTHLVTGNTLTSGSGNGLALLTTSDASAHYLFAFRNAAIDVIDVTSSIGVAWSNSWKTMNTGASTANSHEALRAQDAIVYFCDARYVGSILENSGSVFAPGSAGTYTYNNQALDLPVGEIAQCLEEQSTNLLIGGNKFNKIYPWDRTSSSFNIPLDVPEVSIKKLKSNGSKVYILAGTNGNIYSTLGNSVQFEKKIPDYVANNSGTLQATVVTWGGITARNGAMLIGAGVLTSGNSGVYLLYPDGRLTIDSVPSTGSVNAVSLYADDYFYYMGYASGADLISTSRFSSFETVVHSDFFRVATKTEKGTLSVLEVVTAKPASTGNVRISYRSDTIGTFSVIDTFTADGTTTTFKNDGIGLSDLENIQVLVEVDGDMELVEVRFMP